MHLGTEIDLVDVSVLVPALKQLKALRELHLGPQDNIYACRNFLMTRVNTVPLIVVCLFD